MGNFLESTESVEYYEMAKKERLIGKQICIVGMLHPDGKYKVSGTIKFL